MTELRLRQWTAIGIGLLALLAYWPAVDNPFIADDYALLLGAEKAAEHCTALFAMPLGWRRLVSNFFFTVCYALFGPMAFLFYWTNLWLHVVNALLVFRLGRAGAGDCRVWGADVRGAVAVSLGRNAVGPDAALLRCLSAQPEPPAAFRLWFLRAWVDCQPAEERIVRSGAAPTAVLFFPGMAARGPRALQLHPLPAATVEPAPLHPLGGDGGARGAGVRLRLGAGAGPRGAPGLGGGTRGVPGSKHCAHLEKGRGVPRPRRPHRAAHRGA